MEVQNYEDVLIDVCPSCRGIWLDRGELHKIIAHVRRQEAEAPSGGLDSLASRPSRPRRGQRYEERHDEWDDGRHRRRGKKRSFWDVIEEIID